jgi:F0F1-type ATP synthase assembly protein I
VYNSIAAARRLAVQVVAAQAGATIIVGLLLLLKGIQFALAALGGGMAVTLGTALLALRIFVPPLAGGRTVMARLAVGLLLKWMIVLGVLFLILVRLKLPLLPALAGVGAAMLANILALRFDN